MAVRPIPFSDPMIAALHEGRKTQHRVALKVQPPSSDYEFSTVFSSGVKKDEGKHHFIKVDRSKGFPNVTDGKQPCFSLPYYVGDLLYVQEAIQCDWMENLLTGERDTSATVAYYASDDSECLTPEGFTLSWLWKVGRRQARFMPRAFSRMTLIVTDVRVQRLHEISEEDAIAEGLKERFGFFPVIDAKRGLTGGARDPITAYSQLWDSINGPGAWEANPWVTAITFTVHHCNVDALRLSPKE